MLKVLVVSDTHGEDHNLLRAIAKEKPFDVLIHLGDSQEDPETIRELAGCPTYMVAGNCDYFTSLPPVQYIELEGHKLMLAHGHRHDVRATEEYLIQEAKANDCDLALYGHTHIPTLTYTADEMWIMNPGSLSLPRQKGREASYIVLNLQENRRPEPWIKFFEKK